MVDDKARNAETPPKDMEWTRGVVLTLWTLNKKYEAALKQHQVIPLKESEVDREEVADAYQFLSTPWERLLDGRLYHNLAVMQTRRDAEMAAPDAPPQGWIDQLASEVKRRATPILFLSSREASTLSLSLPDPAAQLDMTTPPSREDQRAMTKHRVAFRALATEELDERCERLISKLAGRRFSLQQLASQLTNWELDLLSQMIRDGRIDAVFIGISTLAFRKPRGGAELPFAAAAVEAQKREKVPRNDQHQ